eukprot:1322076-Amphidinium_carterae.2
MKCRSSDTITLSHSDHDLDTSTFDYLPTSPVNLVTLSVNNDVNHADPTALLSRSIKSSPFLRDTTFEPMLSLSTLSVRILIANA